MDNGWIKVQNLRSPRMEDEEDDVFEPDPHCWHTTFKEIKCEERATQTPGPVLASNYGMLPCGVAEEPRPLFYGNAGFRLHFPANFELVRDQVVPLLESEDRMEQLRQRQPVPRSVEVCIGQKLQLIGDQFHREQLQLYHRNQRNQRGLLWWRLATALLGLIFDGGFFAGRGEARRSGRVGMRKVTAGRRPPTFIQGLFLFKKMP
ncbi:bcl-2-modifying factor-like isoform X2 [Entelurus aequoreus]|uniref:bcl-2-modifying factor-like isoform X2 n=1 Tax=Entelurus aequoreus TaxID=161455 RepID=UPI002B1D9368|nr:bcl-2-modifying factor-like isoform X2 [Entelurus aequoreus]